MEVQQWTWTKRKAEAEFAVISSIDKPVPENTGYGRCPFKLRTERKPFTTAEKAVRKQFGWDSSKK